MKKLILVTSPPASGKTTLAKALAKAMHETVYLDKDTLIPLSKKIYEIAGEPYNRSSEFFENNIRNLEYQVILDFAAEAIQFDSNVIINAPFSREIRNPRAISAMRERFMRHQASLCVIWIECSIETTRQRMINRNSDRDTWKLENWDEYVKTENFDPPELAGLLIYENDTDELARRSFEKLLKKLKSL
jgi:predicted kinase